MRRKMLLKRPVGEMPRVMTPSALFVLGFSASIGISVFDMYPIMKFYGGPCVFSFPLAGLVQLVAVLCYCEMASTKPCMGGPYHYAYHLLSEFEAFLVGWVLMLCLFAGVSYRLKYISSLVDVIFFDGRLSAREKATMPLPSTVYVMSDYPDILALIISFTLAGLLSLGESESARYILACFCACLTYLTILILISVGFGDYSVFRTLEYDRLDVLLDTYLPCSQNYIYIFLLSFLGEETVAANETLPATMVRLFVCCWFWNTTYPVLMLLNFQREDDELNSVRRFLERFGLGGIHVLVLYGVIGGSLCSVFMLMVSLERLILSMSRDGLFFKLFVSIGHSSDTYVAPSFFIGLLSGLFAVFFNLKILREVFMSTNTIAALLGPIFVLKARYLWSVEFVWQYANREQPEPGILTNVVVTSLGLSVAAVGYILCLMFSHIKNYSSLLAPCFPLSYVVVVSSFAFVALGTFITLLFLPQNTVTSKYKVPCYLFNQYLSRILFIAFVNWGGVRNPPRIMVIEHNKVTLRDRARNFLNRITKQKLVITREVATESRVYSKRDMVVFSVSCSLGVNLWRSATILSLYGDVGCYSLMMCGALHLVSFMCYLELTSMQPCLGGAYHYAYNTYGQLIAFLVGWMMLGYFMATTAWTFQMGSHLIDQTIFGGMIANSERMHFERVINDGFFLNGILRDFVDVIPFLLSISFSGVVAAEPNDSKSINQGVFILAFCLLNCLTLVLIGNADTGQWTKHAHFGALLTSFKDVNSFMSAVYCLMFFGEEAKHPKEDIPSAMIWSFLITWLWFTMFPMLLLLNGKGLSFSSPKILIDILRAKGFEELGFAPLLGVTCAVYSSCFVLLFSTVRLLLAMGRDGLMPRVFSKVEHFNKMPVKPTFLAGVIIGVIGMIFKNEFLVDTTNTMHFLFLLMGPVLLLKQRYLYSIVHIQDQVKRRRRPNVHTGFVVFAGAVVFFMFGQIIYEPVASYIVHPKAEMSYSLPIIFAYGAAASVAFIFIFLQPQNQPKTRLRVIGVPYVPVMMIIVYGFIFKFLPPRNVSFVAGWLAVGLVFYLVRLVIK